MVPIQLFTHDVDLSVEFPSTWNELQGVEVIEICKQQLVLAENPTAMKAAIFLFILENRVKLSKANMPDGWLQLINLEDCILYGVDLLKFVFEQNNLTAIPEKTLLEKYQSPNGFSSILAGQFEDAEIYYHTFYKTPVADSLAKIAAIFWLPAGVDYLSYAPKKNKFIAYDYEAAAKLFLKLEPWRLYAIFYWYHGSRQVLPKLFPVMHEPGDENTGPDMLSFTKCIHAGAGPKNGTRDEIRRMKLYEFMFDCEQEAIKAKELKELYERKS